jgi:hypothetical protein
LKFIFDNKLCECDKGGLSIKHLSPVPSTEKILRFYPKCAPSTSSPHPITSLAAHPEKVDVGRGYVFRRLPDKSYVAVSGAGDHAFLTDEELQLLATAPHLLPLVKQAELQSRFILPLKNDGSGMQRLLNSRRKSKRETVEMGVSLHIIVPTLYCGHSCKYCQVSRALECSGSTMSIDDLDAACEAVFESNADSLTVEFQGGDPLLRFDLVQHAVRRIHSRNLVEKRRLRFVVATTLHQLTPEMCIFFRHFGVILSTSLDGPSWLHNKNRPTPGRDSYEKTLAGLELARAQLGHSSVSALMTTKYAGTLRRCH